MDMATLCVCPALKLRLFTASADHLLGIGHEHIGFTLSLCGPFFRNGTLTERIKAVLGSGIAERQIVTMATGRRLLCRLLPLRAGNTAAAVAGVILTFGDVPVNPSEDGRDVLASHDDHKRAGGYPDLAYGLTRRQHQVLGHVLAGHPSKNIAADLGISRRTVENHRAAIMARTGATSLPALARLAVGADVGGDCKPHPPRHVCD
jgi:DNA-binding CsgD family transcriptional regulator